MHIHAIYDKLHKASTTLKLYRRGWYPSSFLFGCSLALFVWLRFITSHDVGILFSMLGAVAAFTYFLYRQHLDQAKLFKELFTEFNARFSEISPNLEELSSPSVESTVVDSKREHIAKYFDLCAEEYFFYKAGYIDQLVWESWYAGMEVIFAYPSVSQVWQEDTAKNSYYGFAPPLAVFNQNTEPNADSIANGML